MKADYLTYKRATRASLFGLALQIALGLTLLIYAVLNRDHAGVTAAYYVLTGTIVWLTLSVVFDGHRRAELEAMEEESIAAQQARSATVFEETAGGDLRVAGQRVAWMHKVLLPAAGLVQAAVLIGLGLWRLESWRLRVDPDRFAPPANRGWEIAIGLAAGVLGFVFARYTSGMAKQKPWANLRAGAAQAVGCALMGVAMAVSQFVDIVGPDAGLRWLQVALPVAMIVLGIEIVLNFLLGIYQPRQPGEHPRPAFDSRILGFAAAPDRIAESVSEAINYQFGFDVTSSWFYQLLTRSALILVITGAFVVWAMTFIAVVGPSERALRLRGGELIGEVGPGPYLKRPWPFERFETFQVTGARRLDLAGPPPAADKALLWTNDHGVDEKNSYILVQPAAVDAAGEGTRQGGRGLSLVAAEVPVVYSIEDLQKYEQLGAPEVRDELLRAAGRREVMMHLATRRVDDVLGRERTRVSEELRSRVEAKFKEMNAGVKVLFVGLEGVHPPTDTAAAFEEVVASEQKRQGNIEQGETERIRRLVEAVGNLEIAERVLTGLRGLDETRAGLSAAQGRFAGANGAFDEAGAGADPGVAGLRRRAVEQEQQVQAMLIEGGGRAALTIRQAQADRWARHMGARSSAEAYAGQLAGFRASPTIYTAQQYFSTLREALSKTRLYIVSEGGGVKVELRADLQDLDTGGNAVTAGSAADN